jgi:ABC-type multidrug transport system ATPase subunit
LVNESKSGKYSLECTSASIIVEAVSKKFGKIQALDGAGLAVNPGTVFALLGPNGSGKTTLVRILTTLLRPDSGMARVGDHDVVREAPSVNGARKVGVF